MIKKELKITNKLGIHARPAGLIAKICSQFACEIRMIKDGYEINPKSIMGILTLAAGNGTLITVITNGKDEKEAMVSIEQLFEKKFEED